MNEKDFLESEEEFDVTEFPADEFIPEDPDYMEEIPEPEYMEEPSFEEEIPLEDDYLPEEEFIEEELLHEALTMPESGEELDAADHDMYSAGLQHPEDAALYDQLPPVDQTLIDPADDSAAYEAEAFPAMSAEDRTEDIVPEKNRSKKDRPARKGRPSRRKGDGLLGIPQLISALIWLLIILAIGVTLGRLVWVCAADVLAFGKENKEVSISITSDDTMDTIAEKLHDAGLVRYPELFLIYADLSGAEEEITTGTFTLNTVYDYMALVNHMSPRASNRVVIEDVLIPEGYSCRQIFNLLEEKGICRAADLEAYAANGELDDYWFLEGIERGDKYCLEGFLFPDTYDFYENSSPRLALEKMLDGFNYRFTEELKAQLPTLNTRLSDMMRKNGFDDEFIAANQLDLRGMLTVASLIEEETANNAESYKIASVIYNRLFSWGNNPRYLNIDAAIFYALGEHKESLTAEDLQIDSPYNTYTHTGLVPGPISNPGLASIQAALDPEDTSYYYYVLDPEEGAHRFNKTYEAHEKDRLDIYGG